MGKEMCKHCGTPLEVRETKKTPEQKKKTYYYTHYYLCPNCHRLYHNDKFKVVNQHTMPLALVHKKEQTQQETMIEGEYDVKIWTDGACVFNGTPRAKAAWAFVAGDVEQAARVEGKQTNNRAEAYAIYYALRWAGEMGYKTIRLATDSQISLHNLKKDPRLIKMNSDIFFLIAEVIAKFKLQITYVKVLGHSGEFNNERVDKLANGMAVNG